MILLCLNPKKSAKFLNSDPLNGGPLSLLRTSGMPCLANMASNLGITALAETEVSISTSGK